MKHAVATVLTILTLATQTPQERIIRFWAQAYGVEATYMLCVADAESEMKVKAYNKSEGAAGLFQWREESWDIARKAMGANPNLDLRFDPIEASMTTGYAMQRGWAWWPNAHALCEYCLDKTRESW